MNIDRRELEPSQANIYRWCEGKAELCETNNQQERNANLQQREIFIFRLTRAQLIEMLDQLLRGLEQQGVLMDLSTAEVDAELAEAIKAFYMLERASARVAKADQRRQTLFLTTTIHYQTRIRNIQAGLYEAQYGEQGARQPDVPLIGYCPPLEDDIGIVNQDLGDRAAEADNAPIDIEALEIGLNNALPILIEEGPGPAVRIEDAPLAAAEQNEPKTDVSVNAIVNNLANLDVSGAIGGQERDVPQADAAAAEMAGAIGGRTETGETGQVQDNAHVEREMLRRRTERDERARLLPPGHNAELQFDDIPPAPLPLGRFKFPHCQNCGVSGHHIVRCPRFLHMGIVERTRRVDALQLCRNCFRRHAEECWFAGCHHCRTKHNSLLCPRREQI